MKYENMTWNDLVRMYIPDATDQLCEYVLWEQTHFPFATPESIEKEIHAFANLRYNV